MTTPGHGMQGRNEAPSGRAGARAALRRRGRSESGQVLIEFAIVIPLLVLFFAGIVDFGLALNTWNTAQNAAREGARIAAISNNVPTIKNRAQVTGDSVGLQPGDISLSCNRPSSGNNDFSNCTVSLKDNDGTCASGPCSTPGKWLEVEGDIVKVNVQHAYKFITPLPRLVGLGSSLTVKASIETRYEG